MKICYNYFGDTYMNKILIHIPHSSLKVTRRFEKKMLLSKKELKGENLFLSDYNIDKYAPLISNKIIFKYSRIMCDVERYKDNGMEEMSKLGMGYIYEYTSLKNKILDIDENYRKYIDKIYDLHHNKIYNKVTKILNKYNECIIIDLHSYSDELVKRLFNKENNPDICIGINSYYDKKLLDYTTNYFNDLGYTTKINYPYSGSLIPNEYFKDTRIKSMMIEINKRILNHRFKIIMNKYFRQLKKVTY